jgi:hypothetical protein
MREARIKKKNLLFNFWIYFNFKTFSIPINNLNLSSMPTDNKLINFMKMNQNLTNDDINLLGDQCAEAITPSIYKTIQDAFECLFVFLYKK